MSLHGGQFEELTKRDPGAPRPNGSKSYWLSEQHPLASTQSHSLPTLTDVVIIGSGITGTSVASGILKAAGSTTTVTVLEARTLCSGATGRNGGNLLSYGPLLYSYLKGLFGKDMALKMLDFFDRTVFESKKAVFQYAPETSQVREVTRLQSYLDPEAFEEAKKSVFEYQAERPDSWFTHIIIDGKQALEEHGLHGLVGAIKYPGNALWPYKFILNVWEALQKEFSARLSIETQTPVTSVAYEAGEGSLTTHPYLVFTPRGIIRASRVIYCTNAYTSHLLPKLRGLMWPVREAVTVWDLEQHSSRIRGDRESWSITQKAELMDSSKEMSTPLLYCQQNAHTGHWLIGGGLSTLERAITADDTDEDLRSAEYLGKRLKTFIGAEDVGGTMMNSWTGIQGMTADGWPLVGQLPGSITGRAGNGEWIAAGYNGGGMCICWLAGEAVAEMIQKGGEAPEWLPETFLLTDDRWQKGLTHESARSHASHYPPGAY